LPILNSDKVVKHK